MIRRLISALALSLGLTAGQPALAQQRSVEPEAAPAEWIAYAGRVNAQVQAWLSGDDETALRLRAYVDQTRPAADQPSPPLRLQLWIDAAGRIERLDFTPFADETANTDLRSLVAGRAVGAPPPRGMLLPLRLEVQLAPAPTTGPAAGDGAVRPT
jgi:hypothetical protein